MKRPMHWFWKLLLRLPNPPKDPRPPLYFALFREEGECRQRARDYENSDQYLSGLNEGRAEVLRRWGEHPSADYREQP